MRAPVKKYGVGRSANGLAGGRKTRPDWDWTLEIDDPKDITLEHRRLAAGLGPGPSCSIPSIRHTSSRSSRQPSAPATNGHSDRDGGMDVDKPNGVQGEGDGDGEDSDASITFVKSNTCTPKRCKMSPRCYNHLGFEKWTEKGAKEKYVESNAGEELVIREGPAGLRNYGATCYANAFLQLWFNNVAFRNGVYAAADEQGALHCLASVFGHLQLSQRPVVDPGSLIDALRLNKGDQQDAAEFSKLFMTMLSTEFTRKNPNGNLVKDLFEGEMEYCTRCDKCGYESKTTSPFLELEINLKDKSTLESRIENMLLPEHLDGDNKYQCPACDFKLQPATRSTSLKKLPPFLHFSLMRFVYDPRQDARKKTKYAISYPRKLELNNTWYELVGVITHEGASAFRGHFTCEVYDEDSKEFYFYSDEVVEKAADRQSRPTKRAKLDAVNNEGTESSRDCYMLVYRLMGNGLPAPEQPPASIAEAINADNTALVADVDGHSSKRAQLADQFNSVQEEKLSVLRLISGDDCLLHRDDLKSWVQSPELATAWKGMESITCSHGQIDPDNAMDLRLVSREAFDRIKQVNPDLPVLDICPTCVETEFNRLAQQSNHQEQVTAFEEFNIVPESGAYLLPKSWLKEWRGRDGLEVPPTDPEYDLRCEHDRLYIPDLRQVERVAPEAVALLKSIFGEFPTFTESDPQCDDCAIAASQRQDEQDNWRAQSAAEKRLAKTQLNVFQVLNTKNYLVPKNFMAAWEAWLKAKGAERPKAIEMEYCTHGLLNFDPQMEDANYITEAGWRQLCDLYNHDPSAGVTVQFTASPPKGKKCSVDRVSKPTCTECLNARKLDFDKLWLPIVKGKDSIPAESSGKRTSRSRGKQISIEVTKDTSIKDLRLEIYESWKVSPLSQVVFYNGREVQAEDTVESLGIMQGDFISFEEIEEVEDFGPDGPEGFGGTALIGRKACPMCTYSNEPMHLQCAMCETPLH